MLLAYLLLFLLSASASTCDATSRNPRIFLHPGGADVPAPSPAIHDHRRIIAKDLFYDAHDPFVMMGATPPLPPSPDMGTSAATMAPSPSPQVDDNGGYNGEAGGGDVVNGGGGEGGPPSSEATTAATEHEERSAWDDIVVRVDYEGPRMDSPSHN